MKKKNADTLREDLKGFFDKASDMFNTVIEDYRLFITIFLATPMVFYVLLSGVVKEVPPALNVSVIMVSATLGGLILAGTLNRRSADSIYYKLLSVARRFILATVLFLIFNATYFSIELIGGIDYKTFEFSTIGAVRALFWWFTVLVFYIAVYIFTLSLIDVVIVLRNIGEKGKK